MSESFKIAVSFKSENNNWVLVGNASYGEEGLDFDRAIFSHNRGEDFANYLSVALADFGAKVLSGYPIVGANYNFEDGNGDWRLVASPKGE